MRNNGTPGERLRRLEVLWQRPQACQTCHGHPSRIAFIDPDTGREWWESLPVTGCPECGARLKGREHRMAIPDGATDPALLFGRGEPDRSGY